MRSSVRSQLAASVLLVVLGSCASPATENAEPQPREASAEPAPQSTRSPTTESVALEPNATPTPRSFPSPRATDTVPIELWYPKNPESYEDFSAMVPVERWLYRATHADPHQRIKSVLDWWFAGPDPSEASQGFLNPLTSYVDRSRCGLLPFRFELVGPNVIVELCGPVRTAGIGEDARILESFHQTLEAAGMEHSALLYEGGEQCFGNQNDDDPLSCLEDIEVDGVGPGFPCPTGVASDVATITGVDEWVNARFGPSLTAKIARRFDLDAAVTIYPSTLRTTGDNLYWVQASASNQDPCVYVAAQFLDASTGRLDRLPPGINFDLPTTGVWSLQSSGRTLGRTSWTFDGAFYTQISIVVTEGSTIDRYISEQEQIFNDLDYDVPLVWFDEVEISGADRAIRPITIISGSGDVGTEQLLVEVDGYTIFAATDVYIEDVTRVPFDEIRAFIDSISIDRNIFLDAVQS